MLVFRPPSSLQPSVRGWQSGSGSVDIPKHTGRRTLQTGGVLIPVALLFLVHGVSNVLYNQGFFFSPKHSLRIDRSHRLVRRHRPVSHCFPSVVVKSKFSFFFFSFPPPIIVQSTTHPCVQLCETSDTIIQGSPFSHLLYHKYIFSFHLAVLKQKPRDNKRADEKINN